MQRKSLSDLLALLLAHSRLISRLLLAVGFVGILLVPLLERPISFDENALLAGSARPTIRSKSPHAYEAGRAFAGGLAPHAFSPGFTPALQAALRGLGLRVSNHSFVQAGSGRVCTNVHAALHSRRGDGKEALVLATPINHQAGSPDFDQDASGLQLSLALGATLTTHLASAAPWLAKDVVWVLPDASCGLLAAVGAWAAAYQMPAPGARLPHFQRSGMLQQALVVELPSGGFNTLQLALEGANGLLPKLDMFWLLRWYCQHYVSAAQELPGMARLQAALSSGVAARLLSLLLAPLGGAHSVAGAALLAHVTKVGVMSQFMARQAAGLALGGHAPFKGIMVDAASLRALTRDEHGRLAGPAGFTSAGNDVGAAPRQQGGLPPPAPRFVLAPEQALAQLGDALELCLRSCSCLVERFHHSLALYLLTGLDAFVSVERYIAPPAALAAALALQAAVLKHELLTGGRQPRSGEAASVSVSAARERREWVAALQLVALLHAAAAAAGQLLRAAPPVLAALLDPGWLAATAANPGQLMQPAATVLGLLLVLAVLCDGLPAALLRRPGSKGVALCAAKVMVAELSVAAAALAAVACLNWALAYATCLLLVPLGLSCSRRARERAARARQQAVLWLSSPAAWLLLAALLAGPARVASSPGAWLHGLLWGSSSLTYSLAWAVCLPAWCLAAWTVLWAPRPSTTSRNNSLAVR